jgi:hypothetical protein
MLVTSLSLANSLFAVSVVPPCRLAAMAGVGVLPVRLLLCLGSWRSRGLAMVLLVGSISSEPRHR